MKNKIIEQYLKKIDEPDKYYVKDLLNQKKYKTAQKYLFKKKVNVPVLQWIKDVENKKPERKNISYKIPKDVQEKILKNNNIDQIKDQEIIKAEKILNIKFHEDYLWILKRFRYLDDDRGNIISGLTKNDQAENLLFLNKNIINYKKLPQGCIVISYDNTYHGLLVLNNITGEVFLYDYDLIKKKKLFNSLKDLIKNMYY